MNVGEWTYLLTFVAGVVYGAVLLEMMEDSDE